MFDIQAQLFKNIAAFDRFAEAYSCLPSEYFSDPMAETSNAWATLTALSSGWKCIHCGKKPSFMVAKKQKFTVGVDCWDCHLYNLDLMRDNASKV